MSSENILVTGGAGFIGSNLSELLLEKDCQVTVVDNFDPYYDVSIKERNISILREKGVTFYPVNILNTTDLEEIFKNGKFDKIVHLAAKAGVIPSIEDPIGYENVNVVGTMNVLELAKTFAIKQVLFISSSSVYGNTKCVPFQETDLTIEPTSPYGVTKKNAENMCQLYSKLFDLNIICLRLFTVYGPRQRPEMAIHKFIKLIQNNEKITLYGNGESLRDYTFVSDITNGILKCLESDLKFEILNLGRGEPVKLLDLVKVIEKNLNKSAKIVYESLNECEMDITCSDISKAQKLIGYQPEVSIEEGVKRFFDWFNKTNK